MYSILYVLTGLAFVVSVVAYTYFCVLLAKDIQSGRLPVQAETDQKK